MDGRTRKLPAARGPSGILITGSRFVGYGAWVSQTRDGVSERRTEAAQAASVVNDLALDVRDRDGRSRSRHVDLGPNLMGSNDLFNSRPSAEGRVKVYGCSPGCLFVSIAVSVALTVLLNVLIRLF